MTKRSKHILTALAVAAGLGVAGPALAATGAQAGYQPAVYQQAVGYGAPAFDGQVEHVRHGFRGGFHRGFRGRGFHRGFHGRGFHRGFRGRGFHRGFYGRGFYGHGFHKGFHGKKFHGKGLAFRKGFRRF